MRAGPRGEEGGRGGQGQGRAALAGRSAGPSSGVGVRVGPPCQPSGAAKSSSRDLQPAGAPKAPPHLPLAYLHDHDGFDRVGGLRPAGLPPGAAGRGAATGWFRGCGCAGVDGARPAQREAHRAPCPFQLSAGSRPPPARPAAPRQPPPASRQCFCSFPHALTALHRTPWAPPPPPLGWSAPPTPKRGTLTRPAAAASPAPPSDPLGSDRGR